MNTLLAVSSILVLTFGWSGARAADVELPCAGEPTDMTINVGDIIRCQIDPVGDSDLFRFSGTTGEVILLTITDLTVNGNLRFPEAQLLAPSGAPVATIATRDVGSSRQVTLPETGTYTVLITEHQGNETETYGIALQSLFPAPPEAQLLFYDSTAVDAIDVIADSDVFLFEGNMGDTILWTVTDLTVNGNLRFPQAQLFAPSGASVATIAPRDVGSSRQETLPETGIYTVLFTEWQGNETDTYTIGLQSLFPAPVGAQYLCYGSTVVDAIDPIADSDVFLFDGNMGDLILWTVTDLTVNGNLRFPVAELFAPSGASIATIAPRDVGSSRQETLPETGTYTVLFTEWQNNETETYSVGLECLVGTCPCNRLSVEKTSWSSIKFLYQ